MSGLKRLLVVDDRDDMRELLTRYLSRHGFAVSSAADGAAALRAVIAERPDLVLLDLMMPELSGHEVLYVIRQIYSAQDLPVIVLTSRGDLSDAVESLALGANDHVTKPVQLDELAVRLKAHLALLTPRHGQESPSA